MENHVSSNDEIELIIIHQKMKVKNIFNICGKIFIKRVKMFAQRLKELREENNLTQSEVAKKFLKKGKTNLYAAKRITRREAFATN